MRLCDLRPYLHDLPVWVSGDNDTVRYECGEDVPCMNNDVIYVTVNGAHELVVEVRGDI